MIAETIQRHPPQPVETCTDASLRRSTIPTGIRLRWVQPDALRMRYELRSFIPGGPAGTCLATMRVRGFFHPQASGESLEGRWVFEAEGSKRRRVVVRTQSSCLKLAVFDKILADGGILTLSDGTALLVHSDFRKNRAELQTPAGETLIRYRYRGLVRPSADVEIPADGYSVPGLPWLLMLGWFLIVEYL